MSVLKAEISRLARKEAKTVVSPVKKASATYRGLIAGLRKQVAGLQKELAGLMRSIPSPDKALQAKQEPAGRFWITGNGVKALRKRLGLTQALFAKLAGVSPNAVVLWERKKGKVGLRNATAGKLQEIRGLGKRDMAGMLGKGKAEPKAKVRAQKKPKKAKPAKAKAKRKAKKS
jgi:transcriptional regulator with XRE-family HTH domain